MFFEVISIWYFENNLSKIWTKSECLCFPGPALCLGPGPVPGPRPWLSICIYPKFVFTGSARGLSFHIPTLSPQFVFTGPDLRFVRTQAANLIYPEWCWKCNQQYYSLGSKYWSCTEKNVFFKITALHSCQLELRPKPNNLCIKNVALQLATI